MATPFECKLYLDWFRYFDDVSVISGVPIDHAEYDLAVTDYDAGNYDSCWAHIQTAVSNARATLVANYTTLRSISEVSAGSISALMLEAMGEGIDPDAFISTLNKALAVFDAEDYIASAHMLNGLYTDLSGYVSAARAGRATDSITGVYDYPAGTTDVYVLEELHPEPAGWAVKSVDTAMIKAEIEQRMAAEGITGIEILEVKHTAPRAVVFIKCPTGVIPPILSAIVWYAFLAVLAYIAASMIVDLYWKKKQAEVEKHKADLIYDYNKWIADRVAAGDISPEVADDLLNRWNEAIDKIAMPEPGMNWMDFIVKVMPYLLVFMVLGTVVSAWPRGK